MGDDGDSDDDDLEALQRLAPDAFAVSVHKQFVDRVVRHCCSSCCAETKAAAAAVEILDAQDVKGRSRARRGYVTLLFEGGTATAKQLYELSPFARQNISWMSPITHRYYHRRHRRRANDDENKDKLDSNAELGRHIWETSALWELGFGDASTKKHQHRRLQQLLLRVDVYPRNDELEVEICRQLQREAAAVSATSGGGNDADDYGNDDLSQDPFSERGGPIDFTRSRSKCTHRLSVVRAAPSTATDEDDERHCYFYYWGMTSRSDYEGRLLLEVKLNNEASDEIEIRPCDHRTGRDDDQTSTPDAFAPLSRAYYKLDEVWTDYLQTEIERLGLRLDDAVGLDLGASPGGWTQVLVIRMKLKRVVAVDRGRLGTRVTNLPQVTHLCSLMENADIAPHGSYSIVVCDASDVWSSILECMIETVATKDEWHVPSVWIITLKLPYKSPGSVCRQLKLADEYLRKWFEDMAAVLYPSQEDIRSSYQVVHLNANSDGERTLIASFEKST